MDDLTDEEILRRALEIMYRKQRGKNLHQLGPRDPGTLIAECNTRSFEYTYENTSFCNCEECQSAVYNECCSCCDTYVPPGMKETIGVPPDWNLAKVEDVIDLTLSDGESEQDHERLPQESTVSSASDSQHKSRSNGAKVCTLSGQNGRLSSSQDPQGDEHENDGWSSDGSGEFDLLLECEKVKKLKKRRKHEKKPFGKDASKPPCKRRKVRGDATCNETSKTVRGKDITGNDSFLPKKCKKRRKESERDRQTSKDTAVAAGSESFQDRLGLGKGQAASPTCLDGLTELEKLATFTVSQLYPQTITDSNTDSLHSEPVFSRGSKNQHTGGVLNDILNKVHLRSKVKL